MKYGMIAVNKRKLIGQLLAALLLTLLCSASYAVQNPDQITVFFPAFEGPEKLGLNVSTVLSLQLAQTTRRSPWPNNPENHNFGEGLIMWSHVPLDHYSISEMTKAAQKDNLLAQIVVAGKARRYGNDVVVELDVVIPKYRRAPSWGCASSGNIECDYRQKNFEQWQINIGDEAIEVDLPKRYFSVSSIVLKPDVVNQYGSASGLPIRNSIDGREIIGETDKNIQFIEYNKYLPGAPTKVKSGGVVGYVSLPELSDETSEFADMVGGILQVFRGDWEWAIKSFGRVLENPKTRTSLKVDALLYRGMAKFKNGENGYLDIANAAELAPYDSMVIRFLIMALLSNNKDKEAIEDVIEQKSYLFDDNDAWLNKIRKLIKVN
jgi:hypothetical protein